MRPAGTCTTRATIGIIVGHGSAGAAPGIEDQQDGGVVGGRRGRSSRPPAQGILDLLVGHVVPCRQPGVAGDGTGPRAKTQQKALRRRQDKEGLTAETPEGVVVHDCSLLSR